MPREREGSTCGRCHKKITGSSMIHDGVRLDALCYRLVTIQGVEVKVAQPNRIVEEKVTGVKKWDPISGKRFK